MICLFIMEKSMLKFVGNEKIHGDYISISVQFHLLLLHRLAR